MKLIKAYLVGGILRLFRTFFSLFRRKTGPLFRLGSEFECFDDAAVVDSLLMHLRKTCRDHRDRVGNLPLFLV